MAADIRAMAESLSDRERAMLLLCAKMPLISSGEGARLYEGAAIASWYRAPLRLADKGLLDFVWRSNMHEGNHRRWHVSAGGVRALALLSGLAADDILRRLPVSNQWRRRVFGRLGAAVVFYSLTGLARETLGRDCEWHWRGRGWANGALDLGERKAMLVARMGPTVSRRAVLHRMGSMIMDAARNRVYGVIFIAADYAQMRLLERWMRMNGRGVYAWVVNERDLMSERDRPIWSRPAWLGLQRHDGRYVFENALACSDAAYNWAMAPDVYKVASMPKRGQLDRDMSYNGLSHAARAMLGSLISWPLATVDSALELAGMGDRTGMYARAELTRAGLAGFVEEFGGRRICATNEGLRRVGLRDQTKIGELRELWGIEPDGDKGIYVASGGALKKLGREMDHTDGVYDILARLAAECGAREDLALAEILPAHRSERWLPRKRGGKLFGVRPDASAALLIGDERYLPFMVEYERRADRPALFEDKLGKYLQYYSAALKMEDWHRDVLTLFVFEDRVAASRFANYCEGAIGGGAGDVPLYISSADEIKEKGWLGSIWIKGGRGDLGHMTFWEE